MRDTYLHCEIQAVWAFVKNRRQVYTLVDVSMWFPGVHQLSVKAQVYYKSVHGNFKVVRHLMWIWGFLCSFERKFLVGFSLNFTVFAILLFIQELKSNWNLLWNICGSLFCLNTFTFQIITRKRVLKDWCLPEWLKFEKTPI